MKIDLQYTSDSLWLLLLSATKEEQASLQVHLSFPIHENGDGGYIEDDVEQVKCGTPGRSDLLCWDGTGGRKDNLPRV